MEKGVVTAEWLRRKKLELVGNEQVCLLPNDRSPPFPLPPPAFFHKNADPSANAIVLSTYIPGMAKESIKIERDELDGRAVVTVKGTRVPTAAETDAMVSRLILIPAASCPSLW